MGAVISSSFLRSSTLSLSVHHISASLIWKHLGTNLAPSIKVIEVVDAKETAQEREKYWVQHYISSGILLTNTLLISLDSHPKEFCVQAIPLTKNFYTVGEAKRKLRTDTHSFHSMVDSGKIKKKDIYDLCVNLFGVTETASYETLLSWHKKNPRTYYVVKQEGIVTGYIGFLYLNEEVTQQIMSETVPGVPMPSSTEVLPFTPGEPIHGLWVGLAVRPGLPSTQARFNGRHLITGAIEVLENLAREGMPVKKLYATARTSDGMRISRKLGFRETIYPGDPLIRYELDLEKSDSPLLSEYKKLAKRYRQREASNNA